MTDPAVLGLLLRQFTLLSLLAIGGANTTVSDMHRFLVIEHSLIAEQRFAELYALSQAAPGPNVLFVALFGFEAAGVAGLIASLFAACGPSTALAIWMERATRSQRHVAWLTLVRQSLAAPAVGLVLATGVVLARSAMSGWLEAMLVGATVWATLAWRWHPLRAIIVGALIGALFIK